VTNTALAYYQRRPLLPEPGRGGAGLMAGSFAGIGAPVAGWVLQIGPLFLCGGAIAPVLGILLAAVGMAADRQPREACGLALGL
jgi:peptidoglycan/LPS O-acetylase OafA/YrhL